MKDKRGIKEKEWIQECRCWPLSMTWTKFKKQRVSHFYGKCFKTIHLASDFCCLSIRFPSLMWKIDQKKEGISKVFSIEIHSSIDRTNESMFQTLWHRLSIAAATMEGQSCTAPSRARDYIRPYIFRRTPVIQPACYFPFILPIK